LHLALFLQNAWLNWAGDAAPGIAPCTSTALNGATDEEKGSEFEEHDGDRTTLYEDEIEEGEEPTGWTATIATEEKTYSAREQRGAGPASVAVNDSEESEEKVKRTDEDLDNDGGDDVEDARERTKRLESKLAKADLRISMLETVLARVLDATGVSLEELSLSWAPHDILPDRISLPDHTVFGSETLC
jgi:hypothetical protein